MFFIVFNNDHRSRRRGIVYHNYRGGRRRCNHSLYRYRRRYRTLGIRRPSRRHRAHSSTAPDPSTVIPVPILITGNPHALPPAIAIFRDHHRLNNYRCRRRRRLNYYSRGRSYNLSLLWREKYVIKVAEKSVNPTGIVPMIDMPSRDVCVVAGASGEKASCQCY